MRPPSELCAEDPGTKSSISATGQSKLALIIEENKGDDRTLIEMLLEYENVWRADGIAQPVRINRLLLAHSEKRYSLWVAGINKTMLAH